MALIFALPTGPLAIPSGGLPSLLDRPGLPLTQDSGRLRPGSHSEC